MSDEVVETKETKRGKAQLSAVPSEWPTKGQVISRVDKPVMFGYGGNDVMVFPHGKVKSVIFEMIHKPLPAGLVFVQD